MTARPTVFPQCCETVNISAQSKWFVSIDTHTNCACYWCWKYGPFPNTVFDCRICQAISSVYSDGHCTIESSAAKALRFSFNEKQYVRWLGTQTNQTDNWTIYFNRDFEKVGVYIWSVHQFGCIQGENVRQWCTGQWLLCARITHFAVLPFCIDTDGSAYNLAIVLGFGLSNAYNAMWLFGGICNMWNILCVQVLNEDELENVTHCKCMSNRIFPTLLMQHAFLTDFHAEMLTPSYQPICVLTHRSLIQCLLRFSRNHHHQVQYILCG